MSSRVRGVSSSPLLDSGDGTFIRTARLGAALGVFGSFAAVLESFCSFLGRPRFFLVQEVDLVGVQILLQRCLGAVPQHQR